MIAINDLQGRTIGFGGRLIDFPVTNSNVISHTMAANATAIANASTSAESIVNNSKRDKYNSPVSPKQKAVKQAKYLNSPETPLFKKSNLLFGLDQLQAPSSAVTASALLLPTASSKDSGAYGDADDVIVIVEGYFDVMSLAECGFSNVVSSMGAHVTKEQVRLISQILISYFQILKKTF